MASPPSTQAHARRAGSTATRPPPERRRSGRAAPAAGDAVRPPPPAAATGPRRRSKATRPQELLDAALALFVEKGFAATRTDDVARGAGVSKGTLYLYYASKEELFKAVVRHNLTPLIAEGLEIVERYQGSTADLLRTLVQVWWERFGNTPAAGIHKIMVAEARNFPELAAFYAEEVAAPADRLLWKAVERGVARGEFRPLPVREVAQLLIAPLIFLALHRHSLGACAGHGPEIDPRRLLQVHLDLVLEGLRPRATAGQPAEEAKR